jgi:RNA polymerase sigma factor (sigma-70 family)
MNRDRLLYHFCRLRMPAITLPLAAFTQNLHRAFDLWRAKGGTAATPTRSVSEDGMPRACPGEAHVGCLKDDWTTFLENLHALDWFLACACLEGQPKAWEALFNARASRTDALLVDALRMRAVRLFPRNEDRQNEAVDEFWGFVLVGDREGSLPVLARYDGQRPLVPWLIRVFQNKHLSEMRRQRGQQPLPDDALGDSDLHLPEESDARWHDEFRSAARDWFSELSEQEVLLLGLRLRYRLSQREVAHVLGIHEGNVSRQTARLRDHCLERIGQSLCEQGWTGDDLSEFIRKEMDSVLLDEPRLSADRLAALLAARGKKVPSPNG